MPRRLSTRLALLILGTATPLAAQSRGLVSLDMTLGPSVGWGGRRNYVNENGFSGEVTIGLRAKPGETMTGVGALSVGRRASVLYGDACVIDFTGTGRCRPHYPDVAHIGVLGGLEQRRTSNTSLRALVGPAFYAGEGASGAGGQVQLDASGGFSHFALMVFARGNLVVRFTRETMRFGSLGFGLRVQ